MERPAGIVRKLAAVFAAFAAAVLIAVCAPAGGKEVHAAGNATIKSAMIQGTNVVVTSTSAAVPPADDGLFHLYAQFPFQVGAQGVEVASAPAGPAANFAFALNFNTANNNLFKKFTIVAIQGGVPTPVSNSMYITNPEAIAAHTAGRRDGGKKGLLPAAERFHVSKLSNYGIKQITYNVPLGRLTSGGGVPFNYNGKTYNFNAAVVGEYDWLVPNMNAQGLQISLILLNDLSANATLIHPLSRDSLGQNYYAFNTADQAGCELFEAATAFLAQRYSNNGRGTVDNWIIGNEVNARSPWHYMTPGAGIDTFTYEYSKALRLAYNAIKSQNANARVYACVDQEFAAADSALHYPGRALLEKLNLYMRMEGNIGWDVAVHPYNVPLTNPLVWTMPATPYANHTQASRYVTMANIDVFTDFMCMPTMLSPNGQVKSILCSEVGYPSNLGEDMQAAAAVYGYMQAMANQHIDGFILSREMDHIAEIQQGLATGILNVNGTPKKAMTWYMTADTAATQAAASAVIGAPIASLLTPR